MNLRIGPYPLTLRELNGAFGDLGVLIPLEAALIAINGLNPTTTLLGVGLIYILAGWYFRLPMPAQPLKALAALAIALQSPPPVIAAAALLMAAILVFLTATRAISLLEKVVPSPVIRGVQLGLGLLLLKSAYQMIFDKPFLLSGQQIHLDFGGFTVPAGVVLGVGGVALLLLLVRVRSIPAALVVVALGIAVGLSVEHAGTWTLGPAPFTPDFPSAGDFWPALVLLVIPQVPLTLANSVIATADAAKAYFGDQAKRATPTRIALSIAVGNLWAGLTGGLPNCHGCGGLTAHYRLGARTPLATTFLGLLLIGVALLFGRSAVEVRSLLPAAALGVLLFYVGVQHLFLGLNVRSATELGLAVLAAAAAMASGGNLAIGALAGLALYWAARWLARTLRWPSPSVPTGQPALRRLVSALERLVPSV
ncbi:MAG: sulfate permease [SAR202 cluster bacterium]|nr:sulfate permease [SAR202 cluster bacterium]